MNHDTYDLSQDSMLRIEAVMVRLYSQEKMTGDTMRNAAQMLDEVLQRADFTRTMGHATYDARLR